MASTVPWFHLTLIVTLLFLLLAISVFFFSRRSLIDFYYTLHESDTWDYAPLPVWAVFTLFALSYSAASTAILLGIEWREVIGNTFWRSLLVTLGIYLSSTVFAIFFMALVVGTMSRLLFTIRALGYHNLGPPTV